MFNEWIMVLLYLLLQSLLCWKREDVFIDFIRDEMILSIFCCEEFGRLPILIGFLMCRMNRYYLVMGQIKGFKRKKAVTFLR